MRQVLLVEDSEEVHAIVKLTLDERYALSWAKSVGEAFRLLEKNSYDLILLDVTLPDGDGFHLCAQIRNLDNGRETPIIFLSGKSDLADKIMGFSVGADDYVSKPFQRLELRARVDAKLNKLRDHKESEDSLRRGDLRISLSQQAAFTNGDGGGEEPQAHSYRV